MRSLWPSLRAKLAQSVATIRFQQSFEKARRAYPDLRRFDDPFGLLDFLHSRAGNLDEKDRILAVLIDAAKRHETISEDAMTLLWLAFWPGLDAIYRRLWRHFIKEPEELTSEIADHFASTINRFEAARVRRVAATVLRNVERDICDGLRRERDHTARIVDVPIEDLIDQHAGVTAVSRLGLPPVTEPETAIFHLQKLLTAVIGKDADLVILVAILGERQREAAARLTLAPDVARKRYQRACSRLRSHLAA